MDNDSSNSLRPSVLSLIIKERASLYASYMAFIDGGGLFIPTQKEYAMGDTVYLILQLMDNPKKFSLAAKIIWLSPAGMSQKAQGVGVQLPIDELGQEIKQYIEKALGSALSSSRKTHTV